MAKPVGQVLDLAETGPDGVMHHSVLGWHGHTVLLRLGTQVEHWLLAAQVFQDRTGYCIFVGVVLVDALRVHLSQKPLLDIDVEQLGILADWLEKSDFLSVDSLNLLSDALAVHNDSFGTGSIDRDEVLQGFGHQIVDTISNCSRPLSVQHFIGAEVLRAFLVC